MMAEIIDARGLRCPWPVLRLAKALRDGAGPFTIVADDPIAPAEIAAFASERGMSAVAVETGIGAGFLVG